MKFNTPNLHKDDWLNLSHFLILSFDFLADSKTELSILNHVLDRTISFRKVEEWYQRADFEYGNISLFGYLGTLKSTAQIARGILNLRKKNVLILTKKGKRKYFCLNIPGIIKFYFETLLRVWKRRLPETPFKRSIIGLNGIQEKVTLFFKRRELEVPAIACKKEVVMKMEQVMANAIQEAAIKEEERQEKRKYGPFSPTKVIKFFRDKAFEYNLIYDPKEFERNNKGKVLGMAKNWLKECERQNLDPGKVIEVVCADFTYLRREVQSLARRDYNISFKLFYQSREKIMEVL